MLSLVVARARDGAIGRAGGIPWTAPEDLRFFQRETLGGALIMGRRTWESLPKKPLPRRLNCVVTRGAASEADLVAGSVAEALAACAEAGHSRLYGIGGARLYAEMLPLAHRLLVTEVDVEVSDADTFFPPVDEGAWAEIGRLTLREAAPGCVLRELLRR
jgi:dihydrofolate reductase